MAKLTLQHQFFLKTADADVERYLRLFTFMSVKTLQEVIDEHLVGYIDAI